jgi:hypothetical protein
MGRRSRQRVPTPASSPRPVTPRERRRGAPTPPWGGFPLIELCALAAIVLGIWGLVQGGRSGGVLLVTAALLGSVAGLEVAIREHLGGYRSHTLLLAGTCAAATLGALVFLRAGRTTMLAVAAGVLLVAFAGLRELFKRRSGGVSIRVR